MGSHIPASALSTPGVPVFAIPGAQTTITQNVQPVQVPQYGELELPADFVDYGTPGNMDLDAAINMLVSQNLDLMAAKLEIPMAEADVLTANLRANPIFYADTQLIPYGHFSFLRPGGPPQSDVNINYPLDFSFKRSKRTVSAREAKSVTEAQLQDAVRNQIDNLYSIYEGVVSAGLTLKFSEVYQVGNKRLLTVTEELFRNGQIQESDLDAVKANLYKAQLQVRESRKAKIAANRALALILNLPLDDVDKVDVFDPVGRLQQLPVPKEELVKRAIAKRPDLARLQVRPAAGPGRFQAGQGERLPRCVYPLSTLYVSKQYIPWCTERLLMDPWRDTEHPALQPQSGKRHSGQDQHQSDRNSGGERTTTGAKRCFERGA